MSSIEVLDERCVGCGLCVKACLYDAIEMVDGVAVIKDNCTLCGACVEPCKFDAIILRESRREARRSTTSRACGSSPNRETGRSTACPSSFWARGASSRTLAERLWRRCCSARTSETWRRDLIAHGADNVYVVDDPELEHYRDEPYADVVAALIDKHKPEIVLTGATSIGRSLIPRVAIQVRTGLTADCTALDIDDEEGVLLQTRPAFGGNIMATIVCPNHRPQMATVRHKVMTALDPDPDRKGEVVNERLPGRAVQDRRPSSWNS